MRIGCPKEIKNHEYRVGLTPESAGELARHGHEVWIESGAGLGIDATDAEYTAAGARIVQDHSSGAASFSSTRGEGNMEKSCTHGGR